MDRRTLTRPFGPGVLFAAAVLLAVPAWAQDDKPTL